MTTAPTTKAKMERNANAEPPQIENMPKSLAAYKKLGQAERETLNEHRSLAINNAPLIRTATLDHIEFTITQRMKLNRGKRGATTCLIFEGKAGTGKTQAVLNVAYQVHRNAIESKGAETQEGHERIPTIYIGTEGATSPKAVAEALAAFMAVPTKGQRLKQLNNTLDASFERYGVELLIIDDVQNLGDERKGREAASQIKAIMEFCAATVVLIGWDLGKRPLLNGPAARQLRKRAKVHPVEGFSIGSDADKLQWRGFVRALERQMPLLRHPDRHLADNHWEYIYDRCEAGNITSTAALISESAHAAIESGEERITKKLMEQIQLDPEAEGQAPAA